MVPTPVRFFPFISTCVSPISMPLMVPTPVSFFPFISTCVSPISMPLMDFTPVTAPALKVTPSTLVPVASCVILVVLSFNLPIHVCCVFVFFCRSAISPLFVSVCFMDASIFASVVFTVPSLISPVTFSAPAFTLVPETVAPPTAVIPVNFIPSSESLAVFFCRALMLVSFVVIFALAASKSLLSALLPSALFRVVP